MCSCAGRSIAASCCQSSRSCRRVWARQFRQFRQLDHDPRLMSARFVMPHRKSSKNDGNDVEAICQEVSSPSMRFVPVKGVEQQAILTTSSAAGSHLAMTSADDCTNKPASPSPRATIFGVNE